MFYVLCSAGGCGYLEENAIAGPVINSDFEKAKRFPYKEAINLRAEFEGKGFTFSVMADNPFNGLIHSLVDYVDDAY
jgi:hypothetical protein